MPQDAEVRVRGFAELAAGTKTLAEHVEQAAPRAFEGVAARTVQAVRGVVPKVSGRLAGSVEATTPSSGAGASVAMGAGVVYAGWIEYGGSRGRPYVPEGRYLAPTALEAEPQLAAAGRRLADDEIGGMRWPSPA